MSSNNTTTTTVTIYGDPASVGTQRVLVVLAELSVPYALKLVSWLDPVIKTTEYKNEKHPFGLIPVMDDDGFILYESRAITKYLVAKYDPKNTRGLMPAEPVDAKTLQARALFDQAISVEVNNFESHALRICVERVFKSFRGLQGSEEIATAELTALKTKLQAYEIVLSKQKYIAGDVLTIADLHHLPLGNVLTNVLKLDILTGPKDGGAAEFPNVTKWWLDVSSRKAWKEVIALAEKGVKDTA